MVVNYACPVIKVSLGKIKLHVSSDASVTRGVLLHLECKLYKAMNNNNSTIKHTENSFKILCGTKINKYLHLSMGKKKFEKHKAFFFNYFLFPKIYYCNWGDFFQVFYKLL